MTALTNTNPDFFRSVVQETIPGLAHVKRTVIYSTLDRLVIGQMQGATHVVEKVFAADRNLTVHALDLVLAGDIVIPRGDVRIYCKTLTIPEGGTDEDTGKPLPGASIDVSPGAPDLLYEQPFAPTVISDAKPEPDRGADGDAIAAALRKGAGGYGVTVIPGDKASEQNAGRYIHFGERGPAAGSITILCDEIRLYGPLVLTARGGQGYPGCDGQKGGPNTDQVRGRGGKGGRAGKGGDGANGGVVSVRCRVINDSTQIRIDVAPGLPGPHGAPGHGGTPRGDPGGAPDPAVPGKAVHSDRKVGIARSEMGVAFDEVFLLKVLQKAKKLYLFNQPTHFTGTKTQLPADEKAWNEIGELAHWLSDVLKPFPRIVAGMSESDKRKHSLVSAAFSMKTHFNGALTYFGWAADWVPSLPFDRLVQSLQTSLAHRARFEESFLKMAGALEEAERDQMDVNEIRASLRAAELTQKAAYRASLEELRKTVPEIESTAAAFDAAKVRLLALLSGLPTQVKRCFKCDMEKVMQAGESFAFTGGEGASALMMGGLQIYSLYESALTKLPKDDGGSISKDHVVDEIVALGGDIQKDASGAVFDLGPSGELTLKPGKRLLLVSLDRFDAQIKQLRTALGEKCTTSVDRAIGEFKDALNEKGEALLRYNIYVLRLGEQYDAFLDTQARLAQLNEKDEPLSPIWLGQVSHLARLYQEQMEESLKTISMLQRKYAYMTLDHSDPIDFVAGMDSLWQDGPSPTSENMNQLIGRVDRLVERLDGYDSDQSGGLTPLPDNENQRGALFVHIKPGPLLERFKQTWTISFVTTPDIAPLEPLTAAADAAPLPPAELPKIELEAAPPVPVIGCDRYHDIRVSHARARIYGATVRGTNTRIHIDVRTGKRSTIIDADGVPHTFFHRIERATSVEHTPDPKFDALDNSDMGAGHVGKLTDTAHDMIGLFTRWTLSVPLATHTSGPNFGLDLSGITGITLHFDVLARD